MEDGVNEQMQRALYGELRNGWENEAYEGTEDATVGEVFGD